MTYKEFGEEAEIEYTCSVTVNGVEAGTISSFSESGLQEYFRKLDYAVEEQLQSQYEDLPEPIEDEEARVSR